MRIIFTGGGTGGHIYPALAIADKVREREPDAKILFLGSPNSIEETLVPSKGYEFRPVRARGMEAAGSNKIKELFSAVYGNLRGIAEARRELKRFKPEVVVGTGGFVSLPVVLAAKALKIPYCIHEQNTYPGRGNLLMAKWAKKILMGYKEAEDIFPQKEKLVYVGNPVRESFRNVNKEASREKLGIGMDDFVVFTFGGSMGSEEVNKVSMEYLRRINGVPGKVLLFGTGKQYETKVREELEKEGIQVAENIRISPYIENMDEYIAASDLIIGRAGALSIAETTACGKGAIYIPLSWSVNNHQYLNAKSIADRGGAILVDERTMDVSKVCDEIEELSNNKEKMKAMEEASLACSTIDAADKIYQEIKTING